MTNGLQASLRSRLTSDSLRQYRVLLFHPLVVLLFSLSGAVLYAIYKLRSTGWQPANLSFSGSFFYVIPIIVPFVAFLFDRAEHWSTSGVVRPLIDVLIVGLAIGRVVANVPLVSGHTLFLTYALFSSRSWVVRISAAVVMLQVLYLKYIVWHDWVTSSSGIVLGLLAALVANYSIRKLREQTYG